MKLAKRLVRTAYLRLHGRTIVYDGVILRFPPNVGDDLLWSLCRYSTQGFEPDTWATLRALLADAGTFLDIGSHIGMYSVLARSIAPRADIIAFEPVPALCKRHRLFCKANDAAVELHQLALSDVNRTVALYLSAEEASEHGAELATATIASTSWQARKEHDEISVPAMTLDTFLAERELKMPLVIKIDAEDHEAAVLRGAAKTITCYQPMIVCEILPRPLRDPNNLSDDRPIAEQHENRATVAVVGALGYVAFAIKPNGYFRFFAEDFARARTFTDFLLIPSELAGSTDYIRDIRALRPLMADRV